MDFEVLQSARRMQNAGVSATSPTASLAAGQLCDVSLRGLPGMTASSVMARQQQLDQSAAGFQLSQSAMLVGTVAALQEESGQLRNQWKSDVSRLESELAQLRSAAAWALPHLAEAQQNEPNLRLMQHGAAMERSCSTGNLGANGAQLDAMMHGALAERLNREHGLDALLAHGAMGERANAGSLMSQQSTQLEAAMMQGAVSEQVARQRALEAMMRQGAFANPASSSPGALAQEAAQLEAAMMRGAVPERATREHMLLQQQMQMQRNSSTGNIRDAPGLADAVVTQMCFPSNDQASASSSVAPERGRATSNAVAEQAAFQAAEQTKIQMLELYKELEKMTVTLQEAKQENSKLKEDKEASETAHARDVAALEGMLQSLSAENDRLTKALAAAEAKLQKLSDEGLQHMMKASGQKSGGYPSTPTSIRSTSMEPASEPGVEQAEIDRIKFKIGLGGHH